MRCSTNRFITYFKEQNNEIVRYFCFSTVFPFTLELN